MYQNKQYDAIVVATFTGEISLEEVEAFANDIERMTQGENKIFLVALPINVTKYPNNMSRMLKAVNLLKGATGKVKRFYGIQLNPIMTFMSSVITQLIGAKSNTVEAKTIDDLFMTLEKDADQFPELKNSIHHLDQIKQDVAEFA